MRANLRGERGIALLEAALVAVTLLALVLGGLAVRQIITRNDEIRQVTSRALARLTVRPLDITFSPSGEPVLTVRTDAIRAAVEEAGTAAEAELSLLFERNRTAGEPYFIEAKFVVVHVDEATGQPTGEIETPASSSWHWGDLVPDAETEQKTNLDLRFEQLVAEAGGLGEGSLFAIPSGIRGAETGWQYLPLTVLVGFRVVTGPGDELSARIWSEASGETMIGASKAGVLRALME